MVGNESPPASLGAGFHYFIHMQDDLHIEDGSNDRMYFTMVPNYILNHSSAIDQALYLQMKRFAGEKNGGGYCSASFRTLKKKMGVGHEVLKKSLDYLLEHKWIEHLGYRNVQTAGGVQKVGIYRVNDIWKLNTEYYQGGSESDHLTPKVVLKPIQGGSKQEPNKNNTNRNTSANAEKLEIVPETPEPRNSPSKRVTPEMREVFDLFTHNPARFIWGTRPIERKAAQVLHSEFGIETLRNRYSVSQLYKSEDMCPQIHSPSEFLEKMPKMEKFLTDRNK
jgi:hypothetical protein